MNNFYVKYSTCKQLDCMLYKILLIIIYNIIIKVNKLYPYTIVKCICYNILFAVLLYLHSAHSCNFKAIAWWVTIKLKLCCIYSSSTHITESARER
jgi:hypothetical protein